MTMIPCISSCLLLTACLLSPGAMSQPSTSPSPIIRPQTPAAVTSQSPISLSPVTSLSTTAPSSNNTSLEAESSPQNSNTTTPPLPNCIQSTTVAWPPLEHKTTVRHDGWVIALIVLAGVGIIALAGIEATILIRLHDTSLLRDWRATWLGQVLIFALFCSFLTLFAFLPFPSIATCGIIRFCVGVCYSMSYAVLFVKLLVILCGDHHAGFTISLFVFVWGVQVIIDIQWMIRDQSAIERINNSDGVICTPGFTQQVQSLIYVMVLIVTCALLSILSHRTRRPGHVDGLFIGIVSGLTIAIWIVWILLGFLENGSEWRDPCVAFGLLTTSYVLMLLMLLPKVYQLSVLRRTLFDHDAASSGVAAYPGHISANQSSYKQAEDRMSVTFYREAAVSSGGLGANGSHAGSSRESLGGGASKRVAGAGQGKIAAGDGRSLTVAGSSGYGSGAVGGIGHGSGGVGGTAQRLETQLEAPSTHVSYSNDLDIDLDDVDYAVVKLDPRALHLQHPNGGGSRSSRQGSVTGPTPDPGPSLGTRTQSSLSGSSGRPQGYKPGQGAKSNYVLSSWAEVAEREREGERGWGGNNGTGEHGGYLGSASYSSVSAGRH